MLLQSPDRVTSALASLEGNAEFEVVVQWLKDNLEQLRSESAYLKDETSVRWAQGGMQVLSEFLEKSRSARQVQFARRK